MAERFMHPYWHIDVPYARPFSTPLCSVQCQDDNMVTRHKSAQLVVAENLKALMLHRNIGAVDTAKLLRVKPFQVRRLMAGTHAMTLRTVETIAQAFGIEPYQLLIPGLTPEDPQILRVLSPSERRLYQALEEARAAKH
jgi:hypothetical protein